MSGRVSVDAEALREFIDSARADSEAFIADHCASLEEDAAVRDTFNGLVARLDVKPDGSPTLRSCGNFAHHRAHTISEAVRCPGR